MNTKIHTYIIVDEYGTKMWGSSTEYQKNETILVYGKPYKVFQVID